MVRAYAEPYKSWGERNGKLQVAGDPAGFNRGLAYGVSVFGELVDRYNISIIYPPRESSVADRVRMVRDLMAERDIGRERRGRFAYRAELEDFARDLEEAKWPSDRDGRVTSETDLEHNQAEHTADALSYGVAYYCSLIETSLPPLRPALHRPLTAGLAHRRW